MLIKISNLQIKLFKIKNHRKYNQKKSPNINEIKRIKEILLLYNESNNSRKILNNYHPLPFI